VSKARKSAPPPARRPATAATTATIALAIALVVALIALAVWAAGAPPRPAAPPAVEPATPDARRVEERRPAPRTTEAPRPKPPEPEPEPEPEESEEPEEPEEATATAVAAPEFATAWARGPQEVVRVKRAVDGDTLELTDGRRVRLVGINTPEKKEKEPLHAEAAAALKELAEGAQVTLEFDEERTDQYDRVLAYVFKGELFVNGELVRRGLAYCYTWEPNTAHQDELITFQRQARGARRGLWGLTPPAPEAVYIADARGHRFHRGSCARVGRISKKLEFRSRDEAFDAGQNPCDECRP
jgi:micrococcal nuclease